MFGRGQAAAEQPPGGYREGMTVRCQKCSREVEIKDPFPPGTEGKLVFGDLAEDAAWRCRKCGYIMCSDCSFGRQEFRSCPACKEMLDKGPIPFVTWLKENPATATAD